MSDIDIGDLTYSEKIKGAEPNRIAEVMTLPAGFMIVNADNPYSLIVRNMTDALDDVVTCDGRLVKVGPGEDATISVDYGDLVWRDE